MSVWPGWISTCIEALLLAAACVAIYEGARRLFLSGFMRLSALMLAVGLLVPVVEGGASLNYATGVQSLTREMPALSAAEPAGGWEKAPMTPQERTDRSTNAAQINFLLSGKLGSLIDATGHRVPFVPTPQALQERESLLRGQKGAEDTAEQFHDRGVRLLASATAFMLIGALVGRLQRRRPR